ncbi:hypothetical protein DV738_g1467, partial [Chaetothyriales sp. CBS 135597]
MDYMQEQFSYAAQPHPEQMFYQRMPYGGGFPMHHQPGPHQLEELYHRYPHSEYPDFVPYQEEYEEPGEVSTRPRLTREQAEVLEAHFQANHKPNSMVKRQLAMQTKLTLPRVANWFQNRRAKAKQQKKQEEFENTQAQSQSTVAEDEQEDQRDDQTTPDASSSQPREEPELPEMHSGRFEGRDSRSSADQANTQQAGWASLQRALRQAELVKNQHQVLTANQMPSQVSQVSQVPQADQLQHQTMRPPAAPSSTQMLGSVAPWQARGSLMDPWTPGQQFQDTGFDFGFDQPPEQPEVVKDNVHQAATQTFVSPHDGTPRNAWQACVPNGMVTNELEAQYLGAQDLPLPHYPESRRGSGSESLTANLDTFALAGDSPQNGLGSQARMAEPAGTPEVHLDIAARRNRPRPAALTSASLRSRSYGAATSMSPTFRTGMPMAPNMVRHVKSQGHSLNARFTGIRKPHSAQRSPINVSTFAEAETWDRLMAQQAARSATSQLQQFHVDRVDAEPLLTGPCAPVNTQLPAEDGQMLAHKLDLASRCQLPTTQHLTLSAASPPVTPYAPEFAHMPQQLSIPPVSAPPQYANFPDYTPPYSAGPLTESSWSDAPLNSPEVNNMPGMTYMQPMHAAPKMDSPHSLFQQFVLPSDSQPDRGYSISTPESKKTEFFIQEFPNQKEEHAHIAQQLSQSRPKNYVFANTAAGDYDHS